MKYFVSLLIIGLLTILPTLGQTRSVKKKTSKRSTPAKRSNQADNQLDYSTAEPPPPPAASKPACRQSLSSNVFKTVEISNWGIKSLSIPQDLANENSTSEPTTNKNVSWTTYTHYWKQSSNYCLSSLEVDLTVTTYNTDFKTIIPDLRPDLATPENLLLIDINGDLKNKNTPGSSVKEAESMEIRGVKGGFFRAEFSSEKNQFMAGWYTYRYYEGRAQKINLTITGDKNELPKLKKIIQSLEIQ